MFDRQLSGLPGAKGAYALCAIFAAVDAALVIMQAVFLSNAIVGVWEGETLGSQIPKVAAFAACFLCRTLARNIRDSRMESIAHTQVLGLREKLAGRLYDEGRALAASHGSASVANMLVEGCLKIEDYIKAVVPKTVSMLVVPFCIAAFVFTQDWISGVIVLVCFPFIVVFMRLIGYTASDESAKRRRGFDEMSNHFLDALRGMETLKSFKAGKAYSKAVYAASERYRKMVMKTLRIAQLSGAVLDIFATCGLAAVAIMLGFRMVEGGLAFLPALIVLMLVPEYFMPIKAYAADYHASLEGKSALSALAGMLDGDGGRVHLGGETVRIEEGETVALVGRSGSGKTTLLDAMAGLVPCEDGTLELCGVRNDALEGEKWWSRVAYIPQDPYVFPGTLKENIAFYNPDCSDSQARQALHSVGLSSLVESMDDGLDTAVGRGGRGLSGGQARRLAVARALVDDSRDVWLLDEPGASLDEWSERELADALAPLFEGRTVVVSTHGDVWRDRCSRVVDVGEFEGVVHA